MGSDTETKILHESRLGAAKSEPCLCINRHRCNGDLRIIHPPHAKGSQAPSGVREESADMYHDHRHRGQDKSENGPQLALESVSREIWHCVAQHFQNAPQRSTKLPGRPLLKPVGYHFPIYPGRAVYGHGPCLHALFSSGAWKQKTNNNNSHHNSTTEP
jgi:hypothetical protein